MGQNYDKIKAHHAEIVALHAEDDAPGTKQYVERSKPPFMLANDGQRKVAAKYALTSSYLIDRNGVVRARWLDSVPTRVKSAAIIEALARLGDSDLPTATSLAISE